MSPVPDESRKKSALKSSAANKANRGDPSSKRVRFDESVNKKVGEQDYRDVRHNPITKHLTIAIFYVELSHFPMEISLQAFTQPLILFNPKKDSSIGQMHVVPSISGLVSPVPSLHFQVHEPPPTTTTKGCAIRTASADSFEERRSSAVKERSRLLSFFSLNNKTYPLDEDTPGLDLNDDEIWYLDDQSKRQQKQVVKLRRSKGFNGDLDRIDVASPQMILSEHERRHSLVIKHWLRSWQNGNKDENRRLLPDSSNGVHIIDGVSHRYYLGIIDFFTTYSFRQKSGRLLKSLLYCSTNHSSAPPEEYANRFLEFFDEHLT